MFIKKIRSLLLAVCATAILVGCNLEYFADAKLNDFVWKPSLAIPIGELSYSVQDLFDELSEAGVDIGQNSDNIVMLTYEAQLQSQSATGFLTLANQSFGQSVDAGLNINAQGFSSLHDYNEVFVFDLAATQNEEYDSVNFSGGNIDILMSSELDAEVAYTLTLNSLVTNETHQPLVVSGILDPSNTSVNFTDVLNKYLGDFSKDANANAVRNKIVVELDYQVRVSPTSVIQLTDGVSFSMTLSNPEFDLVYGYVGERKLDVNFELLNLDFFDSFREGTISFAEPRFSFVFDNSFGFPLGVSFNEIAAITQQGQIIPLTGSAATTPGIVNGPQVDAIGTNVNTTLDLNSTNSNLPELISSMPKKVIIEVNTEANPASAPAQYNFVDAGSELNVGVRLELPMIVNINGLVSRQNVDFDVADDLDQAKELTLRLIAENNLPLGGEIELVFKDENNNTVYTVSERALFDGAPVGSDGRTTQATTKIVDIHFADADIRLLENATSIDVVTRMTTTGASSDEIVKFFSDYNLTVKLAVQADIELTSND
ncbi:hypothetical protein EV198_0045 [Roseivirga ehrenbergii]|uniref:Uncharacterized protein n=1 Tax=Roseivirga ehrenbergii (strain DSM 102268 / JCM 13514 / KCTC 12282 / NCIMB 14502 / KMM 6017) TaxID=279360 RepID=A0A150WZU5_ROSEK|nr:hypothetical protein [Roseivirga ehrenbergii]KYG72005.1 hypothetical protein MB14_08075 [Roseivirga ehrenbergii]TCL13223.1 hypothetical protein EV198_0045 [Roseivirga ehrenbergii]